MMCRTDWALGGLLAFLLGSFVTLLIDEYYRHGLQLWPIDWGVVAYLAVCVAVGVAVGRRLR